MEGTGTNLRLPLNPPFTPAEINATYNNIPLPLTDTTDGIVGQGVNPSCAAPTYACYAGAFLRIWDPNVQPAIANQFNLTIQHQLSHAMTVQVGYVGQTGHHLMVPLRLRPKGIAAQFVLRHSAVYSTQPLFFRQPDLYAVTGHWRLESPPDSGLPTGIKAPSSGTKSNGNMSYNSLQAVLQQDMVHGLQGQVSYTYSKCMSDSTGYYGAWNNAASASAYWQNIYDQRSEWAPCYYDATHVLSAYAIYQLPFGRGKQFGGDSRKAVDEVIGGWEFSPILSVRSGWPLPASVDGQLRYLRSWSSARLPLLAVHHKYTAIVDGQGLAVSGSSTMEILFNRRLAPSETAHRSSQVCAHRVTSTWISACIRTFQITQRFRLQFRTDFVNSLNHPQYNVPNMGMGQTMGQITSSQPPRNIQVALKLYY